MNRKILRKNSQECHVCKKEVSKSSLVHKKCDRKSHLDGVIVSLKYNKFIEHLIAEFKYEFVKDLKNFFIQFLKQSIQKFPNFNDLTLTFIPLHPSRKRWRGYNQSEELAKLLETNLSLEVKDFLVRKKFSKSQVGLKRVERLKNIKDSFSTKDDASVPKKVLIVDDVMTTGATLEECAKVLKENGAKKVYGLVIARG